MNKLLTICAVAAIAMAISGASQATPTANILTSFFVESGSNVVGAESGALNISEISLAINSNNSGTYNCGADSVVLQVGVVPEPVTVTVLGLGALGMLRRKRKV
ncbi:MAG: PEP-CTERM sorting domain-containing protein [bacterium]|jgi:hypothetical protein